MTENLAILGSTGSIGTQTLDVIRDIGGICVKAMSTNTRIDLFEKQIREFKPELVCVMNSEKAEELKKRVADIDVKITTGMEGLIEVAAYKGTDTVVNSVVGNIGLVPTVSAIKAKKNIALANKETLVTSGELVMKLLKENNVKMYPVDSEHSAIFQSLQGNEGNKIDKIFLTASGGPFRNWEDVSDVTVDDALKHPNWDMGKKITIDSATLMNKGLEVIEAKWLFDVDLEQIEVLVHPQSIIHSMVGYEDGAVIAQLGLPDMKVPIQYALTYPERVKNSFPKINFFEHNNLTFERPKADKFPCLPLAYRAIKTGGTMPAVLNAANEIAVGRFINREIGFTDIPKLIEIAMNAYTVKYNYTLDDVLEADAWARNYTKTLEVK
ncbi:MAG: 1-deoxy-D-xylulose-5-phosphate reductoisomerase [Clostridia bacterium]|nr:1-deoxy-D-xylulose-5-phosphate reductoisomerase [Clostridia bacterium]